MRTIPRTPKRARTRVMIAGASALALTIAGFGTTTAIAAPTARTSFPGSVPGFVATAPDAGSTADTTVEGEIFLSLQDETGAMAFATAVSTPGNPDYGNYLTPVAWIAKYAPTEADLTSVEQFLTDNGMTITGAPASREFVVFRGPATAMDTAFGIKLHNYKVGGQTVSAPSTAPSLPRSVAKEVLAVGLGNAREKLTTTFHQRSLAVPAAKTGTSKPTGGASPVGGLKSLGQAKNSSQGKKSSAATNSEQCSSFYDEFEATRPEAYGQTSFPTLLCGYLPSQLRSAGNLNRVINSGFDGAGVTIGIVDAYDSPTIVNDTNSYMLQAGEPLLTKYTDISYPASSFSDEAACNEPSGWQTEQTVDVQSSHSVAPGASIVYSGGFNCGGGIDLAMSKILDNHLADIISNSYGFEGEAVGDDLIMGEENQHLQAAGEGIGEYFATGDSGDDSLDLGAPAANWPATSPFVTAVGGTTEFIDAGGNYVSEVGWGEIGDEVANGAYTAPLPGDEFFGGGNGGISTEIAEPAYQQPIVPTTLSGQGTSASRVIPDVSDLANPETGFQIEFSPITDNSTLATGPLQTETFGGTSLAAPIVAGKMALVQQATGRQIGFANPLLYQQDAQNPAAYHDLVNPAQPVALAAETTDGTQFLLTENQGLSLTLRPGYDDFTGIGSLKVPDLISGIDSGVSAAARRP